MSHLPSCIDYIIAIETPQLLKAKELHGGCVVLKNGKPLRYAGGFCVVFPYILATGRKVAVRCWIANVSNADKRTNLISTKIKDSGLPYFVGFEYVSHGIMTALGEFPIVIMDWVEAVSLKDYIKKNLHDQSALRTLADSFSHMVKDLHNYEFSHGDLQHGNIMVDSTGKLFLVDYDSMFVPGLEGEADEIKGLSGYQHPGRNKLKFLSSKADYFSELIIYTSILAIAKYPDLWTELDIGDTETLIFSQDDIEYPSRSALLSRLKNDTEIQPCIEAIENALNESNIDNLQPLELALKPSSTIVVESLQEKWKPRYIPKIEPTVPINITPISEKWVKRQQQNPEPLPIDVSAITNKWK